MLLLVGWSEIKMSAFVQIFELKDFRFGLGHWLDNFVLLA